MNKNFLTVLLAVALIPGVKAQDKESMYEQASETSGLVVQYTQDSRAVNTFYGASAGGFRTLANSPEQRDRMLTLNKEYLQKLSKVNVPKISVDGQVDYILLKRKVEETTNVLQKEAALYKEIESLLPFAATIYKYEKLRRRGTTVNGPSDHQKCSRERRKNPRNQSEFRCGHGGFPKSQTEKRL
jgi:hypothetical protein